MNLNDIDWQGGVVVALFAAAAVLNGALMEHREDNPAPFWAVLVLVAWWALCIMYCLT